MAGIFNRGFTRKVIAMSNLIDEEEEEEKYTMLPYGSYSIDAIILRVKTNKAKDWIEKFLDEIDDLVPVKVMIRVNPYRTLQLLWFEHFRVALRGQNLRKFLEITNIIDEIPSELIDNKYVEKGVRVIPIAPTWIPRNRVLLELILEYLLGRVPEDLVKKVFYSAFIKMFDRKSIIYLNVSYYQKNKIEGNTEAGESGINEQE